MMFSCPTDDIHSIYLDNELPAVYIGEYEEHIKNCSRCSDKLEKLRSIRNMLKTDSAFITPDQHYVDQSYERLMTRLHYAKTVKSGNSFPGTQFRWAVPAAAAAAIFALVLPMSQSFGKYEADTAMVTPLTRPRDVSLSKHNVVISGTINDNIARNVSTAASGARLADVDVFRPDFDDTDRISIRITVPGLTPGNSDTMEIRLPANTLTGQMP